MKKTFCIVLCIMTLLTCCSCSTEKEVNKDALAPFVGKWDCQESILEERGDEDYRYVGYLTLRVEEDGTFSMYDGEAGNPGMAGTMYPETDGIVRMDCGSDDFDPPFCWSGIPMNAELSYQFLTENGIELLHLTYTGDNQKTSTLVFERWK